MDIADACNDQMSETERWLGTIFPAPGLTIRCYRLLRANGAVRDEQVSAFADWLERVGLATVARCLRDGVRRRDLALARRAARRLEVDPKLWGVAMTVAVCNGTITIEGLITLAQCDAVARAVRDIRNADRVVTELRIATIGSCDAGPRL